MAAFLPLSFCGSPFAAPQHQPQPLLFQMIQLLPQSHLHHPHQAFHNVPTITPIQLRGPLPPAITACNCRTSHSHYSATSHRSTTATTATTEASSAPTPEPHKQSPAQPTHSNTAPSYNHWPHPSRQKPQQTASPPPQPPHTRTNTIILLQPPLPKRRRPSASPVTSWMAALAAAPMHASLSDPINSLHLTTTSQTCSRRTFPTFQHYDAPTPLGNYLHHISGAAFPQRQDSMVARFPRRTIGCGKHTTTPIHRTTSR